SCQVSYGHARAPWPVRKDGLCEIATVRGLRRETSYRQLPRNRNAERGAAGPGGGQREMTAERLDCALCEREPESGSAAVRVVGPIEAIEDALAPLDRDARARVDDFDDRVLRRLRDPNSHLPRRRCEFDGVIDQVDQRLTQHQPI